MADYTAPFHMPTFSDAETLQRKADYVAKNGYTITLPTLGDIVHLGKAKPMNLEEKMLWSTGRRNEIPEKRRIEIYGQKERSKANFDRFMGSPIPNIANSITSILTAMDDTQDAIITLAALGRIAIKFVPKFIARWMLGPVGWLWLIAEIMSILMTPSMCALNPLGCKRALRAIAYERIGGVGAVTKWGDEESRKAYWKERWKWRRNHPGEPVPEWMWPQKKYGKLVHNMERYPVSGSIIPSFAEGIQMAQVSDNIWGVGVCIGPIFGLAYDLISGGVRWVQGEKVTFKNAPDAIEIHRRAVDREHEYARWERPKGKWDRASYEIWKAKKQAAGEWKATTKQNDMVNQARRLHETYAGVLKATDYTYETAMYAFGELIGQGNNAVMDHWDPIANVEGLEHIEIEAYNPFSPLVWEVLEEEGLNPEEHIGWPSLGKRWATYEEIYSSMNPICTQNLQHLMEDCPDGRLRAIALRAGIEAGLQNWACMEGEEDIQLNYHPAINIAEMLLDKRYTFPHDITQEQLNEFGLWCQACGEVNRTPSLREILDYAKNSLGFEFTTIIEAPRSI
jgi:hypothetical protein